MNPIDSRTPFILSGRNDILFSINFLGFIGGLYFEPLGFSSKLAVNHAEKIKMELKQINQSKGELDVNGSILDQGEVKSVNVCVGKSSSMKGLPSAISFEKDTDWVIINKTKEKYDSLSKLNLPINPVFNYKQNDITFKFKALSTQASNFQFLLEGYDKDWSPVQANNEAVFTNLSPGKYIFKLKAINKYNIESDIIEYPFEITPPFYMRWWFFVLSILTIIASIFSFIKYRTHKLIKEKQVLEAKVTERTSELKSANINLNIAIEEIKDSINYAERIQSSILPNITTIKEYLPNGFILFKPRDVVSGDFYWFNQRDGKLFFACVDCTGHGVPGAFMSMIGNSLLNEIILTKKITSPSAILSSLNKSIFKVLKQNTTESKDGMDMALCMIDPKTNTLTYSGANRELLQIRDGELIEHKPTKSAIGGFTDSSTIFNETIIEVKPNDLFYMTTDGYADQFGGEKGKKLMTKNFKDFLLQIHTLPMPQQQEVLDKKIIDWMNDTHEQVDDILVVGIKL